MTSPNISHFSPLKRISCNWLIGAKSVGEVLILMPSSRTSVRKSFRFAACFMTFSRVRSSPSVHWVRGALAVGQFRVSFVTDNHLPAVFSRREYVQAGGYCPSGRLGADLTAVNP